MNSQTRTNIIVWSVIGGIVVIVAAGVGLYYLDRTRKLSPYNKEIGTYTASFQRSLPEGGPSGAPGGGYVVGKVVPVDMAKPTVDWLFFDLTPDLKPKAPAEVGTVAQLRWGNDQIDTYDDGAAAYVQTCQVEVIDLAKKMVVGQNTFRGTDPPMSKSHSGSASGSKPTKEVVNWLQSLPRR
jgi:hypothetical protein